MYKQIISRSRVRIAVLGFAFFLFSGLAILMWYGVYAVTADPDPRRVHWSLLAIFAVVFTGAAVMCVYGFLYEIADWAGRRKGASRTARAPGGRDAS